MEPKEIPKNQGHKKKEVRFGMNSNDRNLPVLSWEEIKKHTAPPDCWMVIHGKVYNFASLLKTHPGGSQVLLRYAGRDGTYPFDDVGHSMESLVYDMPPGSLKGILEGSDDIGIDNDNSQSCKIRGGYTYQRSCSNDEKNEDEVVVTRQQVQSYIAVWNKIYTVLLYFVILVCGMLLICLRWKNSETQEPVNEDIPSWAFS